MYRKVQSGGEIPQRGLQKAVPDKPRGKYYLSSVHYRSLYYMYYYIYVWLHFYSSPSSIVKLSRDSGQHFFFFISKLHILFAFCNSSNNVLIFLKLNVCARKLFHIILNITNIHIIFKLKICHE